VGFINSSPIESCDTSFLVLENQVTGDLYHATRTEKADGGSKWEERYKISCFYYFNLPKDSQAGYNLHVSDEVFNCDINPLPLKYDKSFELIPMQIM